MSESKDIDNNKIIENFNDNTIEIIQKEDTIWMTAETIGIGLEYMNPRISIMKLYHAHKDEIEDFKGVTELVTPGGAQETTIFSEQGIYLLIMFSNQPKAKEFRKWVIEIIKNIRQKGIVITNNANSLELTKAVCQQIIHVIDAQQKQQQQMNLLESKIEGVNTEVKQFEKRYEEEKSIRSETVKKITDAVQKCVIKSGRHYSFFYSRIWDHFGIRSVAKSTEIIGQKIVKFFQTDPIFKRFLERED